MNIVLSCSADRVKSRGAFILNKEGRRVEQESFSLKCRNGGNTLKEYVFETVIRGLRFTRDYVNHDDLLLIKLENAHVVDWLNGNKEYKGYNEYLDEVYRVIESLDCRYLFTKADVKDVKKIMYIDKEEKLEGVDSVFADLL